MENNVNTPGEHVISKGLIRQNLLEPTQQPRVSCFQSVFQNNRFCWYDSVPWLNYWTDLPGSGPGSRGEGLRGCRARSSVRSGCENLLLKNDKRGMQNDYTTYKTDLKGCKMTMTRHKTGVKCCKTPTKGNKMSTTAMQKTSVKRCKITIKGCKMSTARHKSRQVCRNAEWIQGDTK